MPHVLFIWLVVVIKQMMANTLRIAIGLLGVICLVQAHMPPVVPGAFIVEYEDDANIESHLSSVENIASTRLKLDYRLFKGASIRFHDVDTAQYQAELLAETAPIKKIWPVYLYEIPQYTVHWDAGEDATEEDQNAHSSRQAEADTFSTHVMTQVNQLRDAGVLGEGIKVAVVDTGVSSLLEMPVGAGICVGIVRIVVKC